MTQYHPMAKVKGQTATFDTLFTYDGLDKIEDAYKQFIIWGNSGYYLTHAWIDVYINGEKSAPIEVYKEK